MAIHELVRGNFLWYKDRAYKIEDVEEHFEHEARGSITVVAKSYGRKEPFASIPLMERKKFSYEMREYKIDRIYACDCGDINVHVISTDEYRINKWLSIAFDDNKSKH